MPDNAFLGRPALSKFMEISHYAYLVLKIPGPHSVISIRGDAKRDYDYDRESCDRPWLSPPLADPIIPEAKTSKTFIQTEDSLSKTIPLSTEEPSKVAHVGNNLNPK
jgi:hypothetical protein